MLRNLRLILRKRRRLLFIFITILIFFLIYFQSSDELPNTKNRDEPMSRYFDRVTDEINNKTTTFLIVLIMTGPEYTERRDAIRKTWLKNSKNSPEAEYMHYFVIGTKDLKEDVMKKLAAEQKIYRDLIFLPDLKDAYEKLTEKLGLMFTYISKNFNFKYVFKADDDTYAAIDTILYELKNNETMRHVNNLYWGYFYGRAHVKKSGPWEEKDWKLCDYYLPHARGGGYITSSNLVDYVALNFPLFKLYKSEDISLGAWLAPLDVTRIHDVRFNTEYKSRGCKNAFIVTHKQSIENMLEVDTNLKQYGKMCLKETNIMNGYFYDWNVPPSQCCKRTDGIP